MERSSHTSSPRSIGHKTSAIHQSGWLQPTEVGLYGSLRRARSLQVHHAGVLMVDTWHLHRHAPITRLLPGLQNSLDPRFTFCRWLVAKQEKSQVSKMASATFNGRPMETDW